MSIPKYKTILYATDLGEHMRPVFRHAIGLARQYDAKIIMIHVVEPLGPTGEWMLRAYMPKSAGSFTKDKLEKILKKMKKRVEEFYQEELSDQDKKVGLVSNIYAVSGDCAEQINSHAESLDVDLIVMGTHTDDGFGHGLLGSTARKLTHISKRPVLVVPVQLD
jgi:nucleotide-binding universal stress UspA family protein